MFKKLLILAALVGGLLFATGAVDLHDKSTQEAVNVLTTTTGITVCNLPAGTSDSMFVIKKKDGTNTKAYRYLIYASAAFDLDIYYNEEGTDTFQTVPITAANIAPWPFNPGVAADSVNIDRTGSAAVEVVAIY